MAESTRSDALTRDELARADAQAAYTRALDAKIRATWEAGYRAALRDGESAALAWEHGDDETRFA